MKKLFTSFIIGIIAFSFTGCNTLLHKNEGVFGKSSKSIDKISNQIDDVTVQLSHTDQQRLTSIGAWSKGVEHSLDKATNKEPAIVTAQKINERVEELANHPDIDELKQVYKIVDTLLTNEVEGQKLLDKKDKEIAKLQQNIVDLNQQKQDTIKDYMNAAEANAAKADQYQATLKGLQGGWGINAIWFGIKTLVSRIAIGLGIFAVLFFVLRLLAASNPIAGSIFSIFEIGASWVINSIKSIFPKSVDFSKLVPTHIADGYKSTLKNIMDEVLLLEHQQKSTNPPTSITLDQLVVNIQKNLNDQDKINVAEIKGELNWK